MNRRYPSVASLADHRCEYCRAPEAAFNFHMEVEHIIPLSRGGADSKDNLALACQSCNLHKSDHLTAWDEVTQSFANLFHPRQQNWEDHFRVDIEAGLIRGLTPVGRATIECLRINSAAQIRARLQWMRLELFP